ncbi:MAG TPA: OsmC family protein [Methylomirabilota bacterium]|nr:OsmC family protein [Methylomirabilota bacterium]
MYGTLRGALAGRKIAYDRATFKASVDGRIRGVGKTIRITSIHVHYDVAVPPDAGEATKRALAVHPQGCPAHQSVEAAIKITWDATLRVGDHTETVHSEETDAATA